MKLVSSLQFTPFSSRSNLEIAQQVLEEVEPSKWALKLISASREEFISTIGLTQTRIIGYFPDPFERGLSCYRQEPPKPFCNKVPISEYDDLLLYIPTYNDSNPGDMLENMARIAVSGESSVIEEYLALIEPGQVVRIERESNSSSQKLLISKIMGK
jgi:hypothetical protein